ncbi:hypothetical protein BN2475_380153 [Paraburkholderia ribeironis]|uniref:Uncharacterized protein n=1 Tax=Paraburkholderia ribeironis TaxID=1247936 RepID=A0A1N7S7A9_9BURK|nr:hypothetical protein BN2475_380153 [Paraburkholderia ribeironis]
MRKPGSIRWANWCRESRCRAPARKTRPRRCAALAVTGVEAARGGDADETVGAGWTAVRSALHTHGETLSRSKVIDTREKYLMHTVAGLI